MTDTSRLRSLLVLGVSAAALASAAPALAQSSAAAQTSNQANATTTAPAPGDATLPEVIVTAEKRQTNLQKVPVAVSVFTAQERDNIGISSVQDVTNYAPGFTYDPGNVHAYIRGVGRQSIIVTNEARVAAYEDGFYVYSPYNLAHSTLFLKQEQIERGPQNVGGKNADAGSIDMISVRPTDIPYGEVRGTFENYAHMQLEGAASDAITPWLDGRIAGYTLQQDRGFFTNVVPGKGSEGNDLHEYYLEGQLQAHFGDKAELWVRGFLSGWHNRGDAGARNSYVTGSWDETNLTDANGYPGAGLFVNPNFGYTALSPAAAAAAGKAGIQPAIAATLANVNVFDNPTLTNIRHFAAMEPRNTRLKNYDDLNYIFTYHLPGMDFKYVGGIQGYNYTLNFSEPDTNVESFTLPGSTVACPPFAGSPLAGLNCPTAFPLAGLGALPPASQLVINPLVNLNYKENDWWTSHEFSLESTSSGPLQWIAGGMYFYQRYQNPIAATAPLQPQVGHPLLDLPPGLGGTTANAGKLAIANPNNYLFFQGYDVGVKSYDAFGQVSYKFNDDWKVTGNLRYTHDEKAGVETARYVAFNQAIIGGLAPILGASTPSLDITVGPSGQICPTGIAGACTTGGPTAPGVSRAASLITTGPMAGAWQRFLDGNSDAVTGGAGIEYTPNRDTFIYARYSRGYQGLSFNAGFISSNPLVAPEFINAYEVGYKQNIGRTISFDADVFYYDYSNIQVPLTVSVNSVTSSQFLNVPKAVSEGFEFEGNWAPIRDLLFTMSYSYNNTEFRTGCSLSAAGVASGLCIEDTNDPLGVFAGSQKVGVAGGVALQSIKGNPLPNAAKNKFAFNTAYTLRFEPGSLTLSASYIWRDTQNGTVFDRTYDQAPAWDQVDLRALWRAAGDRYEVIGYIRNAGNTTGYEVGSGGAGLLGNATQTTTAAGGLFERNVYSLTPPRTYGIELRYKFF